MPVWRCSWKSLSRTKYSPTLYLKRSHFWIWLQKRKQRATVQLQAGTKTLTKTEMETDLRFCFAKRFHQAIKRWNICTLPPPAPKKVRKNFPKPYTVHETFYIKLWLESLPTEARRCLCFLIFWTESNCMEINNALISECIFGLGQEFIFENLKLYLRICNTGWYTRNERLKI